MKILVINGSPKDKSSNTMQLTQAFLEGAKWDHAEIISISKSGIKGCTGCYSCWNKTPGKCVIKDDMDAILRKMIEADVIIWSFPLYYFNVPGKLKNLIDRQLPMLLPFMNFESENGGHPSRYDLSNQRHIVISTCGFWTAKNNYDSVIPMFDHFCGTGNYTTIFCGQGELFRVPELRNRTEGYLELVQQAGAEYVDKGISPSTISELSKPLYPRDTFEKMADVSWGIDMQMTEKTDESLIFTKQMAALYTADGKERVLEFFYTDINKTYQLLLTKNDAQVITEDFHSYTTRIETPLSVWRAISRGEMSGYDAMFKQQYKVLGDFDLMLKWDNLFGGSTENKSPAKTIISNKKTNMIALLLPWIVIWSLGAINPLISGVIGVLAVSLVPLFWLRYKPVIFEYISLPMVALLSILLLLGLDQSVILTLSYGLFGATWLTGTFTKKPLTAYYSANQYGNDKAFSNPLFMRTNRILTAAWAVLYLVTAIWTYYLMNTPLAHYILVINSVFPVLMGLFTMWFQKWYPAYFARRK